MIRPVTDLDLYRYIISDVTLSATGFDEPVVVPPLLVSSLVVTRSYEKDITPLMLIRLHVKKSDYEKVITSMNDLTASFTLYKNKHNIEANEYNETMSYNEPYISGTFKAYNPELLDTRTSSQLRNDQDFESNNTQNTVELSLYMYDYKSIIKYKTNHSYISTCTTNECIFMMLKDRGFSNVLMSPSMPNTTQEFVIPYGDLGHNLSFLDEYYGIYDSPRTFFVDFDQVYLLDKMNSGQVLRADELPIVSMYMEKTDEYVSARNGCYVDLSNGQYILNASPFSVNDNDSMLDFYSAGKITSMLSGTSEKFEDVIGDYPIEKSMIVNNEKSHKQAIYRINCNRRSITIEFSDIDMGIITPNKKYSLIPDSSYSEDYNVKGSYRLVSSSMVFRRETENIMKGVVQCNFSKMDK